MIALLAGKRALGIETGHARREHPFNLLIDIQTRMADKRSPAYRSWATVYKLKQMSSTFMFLRANMQRSMGFRNKTQSKVSSSYRIRYGTEKSVV